MIQGGLFNRFPIDATYGMHNMPSLATGHFALLPWPIMACENIFKITIHGKGGHAALPHLTIDPIVVASEIALALQTVISRTTNPVDSGVVSVTDFIVGATRNATPEKVVLREDVGAFTPEMQPHIETTMARIPSGICSAHDVQHSFKYSHELAVTINSANETIIVAKVASEAFGGERVNTDCRPIMASAGFRFKLQHKPSCYLLLRKGGEGSGGCGLHSPHYNFNDDILETGSVFWVHSVQSQLNGVSKV